MRKAALIPVFLALALLFSACGREMSASALAEEVKKVYTEGKNPTMTALVTADYGSRAVSFRLKLAEGRVTILAPESVAGISARLDPEGITLLWDGAEVFSGALTEDGLSPAACLPLMLRAWASGLVTSAWYEKAEGLALLAVDYRVSDAVTLRTLFDRETLLPVSAELLRDGSRVLSADFENVLPG